jgi:hypothetical protein
MGEGWVGGTVSMTGLRGFRLVAIQRGYSFSRDNI